MATYSVSWVGSLKKQTYKKIISNFYQWICKSIDQVHTFGESENQERSWKMSLMIEIVIMDDELTPRKT